MSDDVFEDLPRHFAQVKRAVAEGVVDVLIEISEQAFEGKTILTVEEARHMIRQIIESTRRIGGV